MEEFINDFCYTLARIIKIEEKGVRVMSTKEKMKAVAGTVIVISMFALVFAETLIKLGIFEF